MLPSGSQRTRSPVRYIRASGRCGEGVGDEAVSGEIRVVEIAAGEAVAGDVELAGDADRDGLAPRVEDVDAHVVDGTADGRLA